MSVTFLYKCRRCGGTERNPKMDCPDGSTTRATAHLVNAIHKFKPHEPQTPSLLSLHSCEEGACGLADLIGYEREVNP